MKSRITFLFILLSLCFMALISRTAWVQILPNARLGELKARQFETVVKLEPRRGDIFDRFGQELAVSLPAYSLFADPSLIERPRLLSVKLSPILKKSPTAILEKLKQKHRKFVWLERRLSLKERDQIRKWGAKGLSFVEEHKRIYPNERLASQVLGFVGGDGRGLEGLEAKWDDELRGSQRKVNVRKDARGRPLVIDGQLFSEMPDGASIVLTIDRELQYELEKELQQAMEVHSAAGAYGVILDAKTSEILAMSSLPSFNPNDPMNSTSESRRNRVITDPIEPGSTLKTLTMAAGLKKGVMQPNSIYNCENGFFKIGKRVVREADEKHRFGKITANEILQKSSNIGSTKIAFQVGGEDLRNTLLEFGIGTKLLSDLAGESKGILPPLPWKEHLLSNISFGHGVAATPIQIASAYAAIANGGSLMRPFLIKSIRLGDTGELLETEPQLMGEVLTPDVAQKLTYMLVGVTSDEGTGKRARVPGYPVAGKTGTSQKARTDGRGYVPGSYISSFAGFVPATAPRFVIYIAIDGPKKDYYGSDVAAPIFSRVASQAVRRAALAPTLLTKSNVDMDRNLESFQKKEKDPNANGLRQVVKVKESIPSEGITLTPNNITDVAPVIADLKMPELIGLSLREALEKIQGQPVKVEFHGRGLISRTYPEAGEKLPQHGKVVLELKAAQEIHEIK
ncbi:MAG: PASTA domain-containing protein [Bdellovibrionales bacterium]|nr:PASTA domain-containing protein [Bdellovibrionales bacterium]